MPKEFPGNELVTHGSFINELSRRTGLTQYVHQEIEALPAHAILHLGELSGLPPTEDSAFAQWIFTAVEGLRRIPTNNRAESWPLSFPDYLEAVSKRDTIQQRLYNDERQGKASFIPNDSPELRRFFREIYKSGQHTSDFPGYVKYLGAVNFQLFSRISEELQKSVPLLREQDRRQHSYVVGGSGSGKSELLKLLIHHYVKHPELGAVLVLDPHGKIAREVARWQEFAHDSSERLVYLDAMAKPHMDGLTPSLNPLQRGDVEDDHLADLAEQLANALAYLAGEGESQTSYMRRLGTFGIHVLLERKGSTLADLLNALSNKDGEPLASIGRKHPNGIIRNHFENMFSSESYKSSRNGLAARLEGALTRPAFYRMMTVPHAFNLVDALDAGKVVLVNCASAGEGAAALGRFLMAQVAALGMRRVQNPYRVTTPIHVFVDEATVLMAPPVFTILEQLRKAGIHLTMVQQSFGRGLDKGMQESLKTNTHVKMFGRNDSMGDVFKVMNWERGVLPKLAERQFIISVGGQRMVLSPDGYLADDSNAMSEAAWEQVLERQFAAYYRRANDPPSPGVAPAKTEGWESQTWERG